MKLHVVFAAILAALICACSSSDGPGSSAEKTPSVRTQAPSAPADGNKASLPSDPWKLKSSEHVETREFFLEQLTDPKIFGGAGVTKYINQGDSLIIKWDEEAWDSFPYSKKEELVKSIGKTWNEIQKHFGIDAQVVFEGGRTGKRLGLYTSAAGADVTTAK